jgi:hypothetical protein
MRKFRVILYNEVSTNLSLKKGRRFRVTPRVGLALTTLDKVYHRYIQR